ncbi:DHH family phosphoesterase [[Clostridium] colinum]|uniref:DHH family phosphoesterase n=1 Tax=[Clostridium] colinum TaxID=36835 RepID=UPI00202407C3|nr:bifunctional oligoribonuclease/PAP phosphatase NrnA [[Clostridium] colinum]
MNNIYKNIEPFIQEIEKSKNIVIAGHTSPDGDAICSALSLGMTLEKMNKSVTILLEEYESVYNYVKGHYMVYKDSYEDLKDVDLFISVDCGDINRLGDAKAIFEKAKKTVNIDHHISNDNFGDLNIVNDKASSTSEIIFEIINHIGAIDLDIATAVYTGIVFDTGGFKHNCTSKRTHQIAGELVAIGVDTVNIYSDILSMHTLENSKLLSKAIQNIYIEDDIIISTLSKQEMEDLGASHKNTGGIVQYLLDIKNINVAVFLYEKNDKSIKVSFRSKTIDVNKIASSYGGGGHILAAGATILDMTLEQIKNDILQKIKNV